MNVKIEFIGLLHIDAVPNNSVIEIPDKTTLGQLFKHLKIKEEHGKYISAFVNGEEKKLNYIIQPNDRIKLFLPTGGG